VLLRSKLRASYTQHFLCKYCFASCQRPPLAFLQQCFCAHVERQQQGWPRARALKHGLLPSYCCALCDVQARHPSVSSVWQPPGVPSGEPSAALRFVQRGCQLSKGDCYCERSEQGQGQGRCAEPQVNRGGGSAAWWRTAETLPHSGRLFSRRNRRSSRKP
jgi:hypothetical protein